MNQTSISYKDISEEEKKQIHQGERLPVMEQFYTIQGEGSYAGHAAYFIRLAGCDVGCFWCDVKESWTVSKDQLKTVDTMLSDIPDQCEIVVITGGEPLIYNLDVLTRKIHDLGKKTHVETSGAYPLSGDWDWICLSPKKFKTPLNSLLDSATELKVIVYNLDDFKFANSFLTRISENCLLYLQLEWSVFERRKNEVVQFIKENPIWKISVQTHKFLNID